MKFAHQVPAILAVAVAVSVLPGGRFFVGAQTSTVNSDFLPNGGSAAACTTNYTDPCDGKAQCMLNYAGTGIDYCVCNDGYTGDGLFTDGDSNGNTGCDQVNECSDDSFNDCIAVSGSSICTDAIPASPGDDLYVCDCPEGTVGASDGSFSTDATNGGDGKTLASGGSGCPASTTSTGHSDLENCEGVCVSPDASCVQNYLGVADYSCACDIGFKGDGTVQDGCTRLTPVLGEQQTLGTASQKIDNATAILETYLTAKGTFETKQCQLVETTDACTAATALYNETLAEFNMATFEYNQAVNYQQQKLADWAAANATDGTAAERTRLESAAKDAYEEAVAAEAVALAAKDAADTAQQNANGNMTDVCDTTADCSGAAGSALCVGQATAEQTSASTAYGTAKSNAEADNLIPEILTPDTAANPYQDPFDEFVYGDSDGDLIPDKFDACPTQMGLRRVRRAQGIKTSTSVGGVAYYDDQDVWTNFTDPGPQDFCPSGCPETDENDAVLDTDGDGINDCEDRCPFVAGISYNHAWTQGVDLNTLDRNLDYNGCPDFGEPIFVFILSFGSSTINI